MTRRFPIGLMVAGAALLTLSACQNVQEQLGLTKQSPDEFRVLSRAPLSLPPNYNLRPPEPGAARPQVGTPTQQARRAVFRADDNQQASLEPIPGDSRSLGELALLREAGADQVDSDIRQVIDQETNQLREESESFINRLVFWQENPEPGYVVDAEAEARRIRENEALGRPVTDGATPTVDRKRKALFEGIF